MAIEKYPVSDDIPKEVSVPFTLQAGRGLIKGVQLFTFNGFWTEYDTATLTGANNFGNYTWADGAGQLKAVSTSDEDEPTGEGVKNVLIYGLDADGALLDEPFELELNGTTQVNTGATEFLANGIYKVICNDMGSASAGNSNVGDITFTIGTNTVALIEAAKGESRNLYGTVPINSIAHVQLFSSNASLKNQNGNLHVMFQTRANKNKAWTTMMESGSVSRNVAEELAQSGIPAGTQIRILMELIGSQDEVFCADIQSQFILFKKQQ